MFRYSRSSFVTGFLVLFAIYHFPEFYPEFWVMAVFKIGFLVAAFFVARAQGGKGLGEFGLPFRSGWAYHLAAGLLLGLLFFSLSTGLTVLMGYEEIVSVGTASSLFAQLPLILLMTVFPSLAEDILTRGYLYAHLAKYMKPWLWVLLSALVYVLNHIWRLDDGPAVLTYLFILGLVLAYVMVLTKSLWLAFGIHWGANIAFEAMNGTVQTAASGPAAAGNWVLAGTWGLLLTGMLLARMGRKQLKAA